MVQGENTEKTAHNKSLLSSCVGRPRRQLSRDIQFRALHLGYVLHGEACSKELLKEVGQLYG